MCDRFPGGRSPRKRLADLKVVRGDREPGVFQFAGTLAMDLRQAEDDIPLPD